MQALVRRVEAVVRLGLPTRQYELLLELDSASGLPPRHGCTGIFVQVQLPAGLHCCCQSTSPGPLLVSVRARSIALSVSKFVLALPQLSRGSKTYASTVVEITAEERVAGEVRWPSGCQLTLLSTLSGSRSGDGFFDKVRERASLASSVRLLSRRRSPPLAAARRRTVSRCSASSRPPSARRRPPPASSRSRCSAPTPTSVRRR